MSLIGIASDGTVRYIINPREPMGVVRADAEVFRASHINPVNKPGHLWHHWHHADMTPLAEFHGRPEWAVCLWPPSATYAEAQQAEEQWLQENYLKKMTTACSSTATSSTK